MLSCFKVVFDGLCSACVVCHISFIFHFSPAYGFNIKTHKKQHIYVFLNLQKYEQMKKKRLEILECIEHNLF